ncbi:ImmA/IrrE family metallo-endopeptidase [Alloalcanivorax gelatiniphagus]|uniref:Uncharacterized protein n=1 Tax=Alloalcanivorax gelatiniphagus TaxID=1194167 RepID=A0ABY2XML6_9GAMM|nr:hypothetical protein [Alloalcanivorax gelatiniphagus]TMW13620.1 hypothetical protein FGS76_05670 [Alloalcanivorax gelatiniphagus]
MSERHLDFAFQWEAVGNDVPELYHTMARLSLSVNNYSLTRNEDCWSRTVKDDVLVALYPLASWLASSWWRLLYEPHPGKGVRPSMSWRMAHELASANQGFIWPTVMFATDGEGIQLWSRPSDESVEQSVRYLNGSRFPFFVPVDDFRKGVSALIDAVLNRLQACGCEDTELRGLWTLICEETADTAIARLRAFEAMMGYDPEECPESLLKTMSQLATTVGEDSLPELMSALAQGNEFGVQHEKQIECFFELHGIQARPNIPDTSIRGDAGDTQAPWRVAVEDAKIVRDYLGCGLEPIPNSTLFDALSISSAAIKGYTLENRSRVSVAIPENQQGIRFMPRKKHPVARRFEYARLLGDCMFRRDDEGWLVSSDLGTFRQKYQRAFAAELLCPIEGVKAVMQGDYSDSAIDEVAEYFDVSTTTVTNLLANNHLIETEDLVDGNDAWPYRPLAARA